MSRLVPNSTVTYMVHIWAHGPIVMAKKRAKDLLKKHGGSYHWLGEICHVYLPPKVELVLKPTEVKGITKR